jgi:transcriptional regulator GlxA family with amidase domain
MKIVFFIFDRITALDAIGPYEVLARLPSAEVQFAAPSAGLVRTDNRCLGLQADVSIDEISACDLLVVPGGFGTRPLEDDTRVIDWIRAVDRTTRITASVCTGSFLLARAGLLSGRRANSHWTERDRLATFGAIPCADRVVRDGKYATAAGVSAGIDLALTLAVELSGELVAQAIQLALEYAPEPPLDSGNEQRASETVRALVRARSQARQAELAQSA